jgi:hypothetical protein
MAIRLAAHKGKAILQACGGDGAAMEGAYRLVRNREVAPVSISDGAFEATAWKAVELALLVVAEDTTTLTYAHGVTAGLGDVGGPAKASGRGWLVHSSLVVDARSGRTVGLIDQQWWMREASGRGRKHRRRARAYPTKESYKWEAATGRVADRLGEALSRTIFVCDREADVYEYLEASRRRGWRFVVRVSQDRRLAEQEQRVWGFMESQPVVGRMTVRVPQKGGRKARVADLAIRSARVVVQPPKREVGRRPEPIALWVVYAVEDPVPAEVKGPLAWMLWTSEPAETVAAAQQVVGYYKLRWRVEEFHKAWKSGTRVEHQRLQCAANLERMGRVLAFVAVRLLQLREWKEAEPSGSCEGVLEDDAWQCLWLSVEKGQPLPQERPTVAWAFYALARLGGWYDTKRTGRVGWEAMWEGWFRLRERLLGWRLALERMPAPRNRPMKM